MHGGEGDGGALPGGRRVHLVRRTIALVLALALAAGWAAGAAVAQQLAPPPAATKHWRLGYLTSSRIPHLLEALHEGLRERGYVEGQNLTIEYRFEEGQPRSLDELAA